MLLVSLGSQAIPAPRIVNDVINSNIDDEIIIQYAYDKEKYEIPSNIKIITTVPYEEMKSLIEKSDVVITSGTGNIIKSLKMGKRVIIFPRLGRYNEAVDDHGMEMKILADLGYAEFLIDGNMLKKTYEKCKKAKYKKFESNTKNFINELDKLIQGV